MAEIGIVQYKSSFKGGAETVCMHMISALAKDHKITFFTPVTDDIDFHELSEFHNLSFDQSINVECFKSQQAFNNILDKIDRGNSGTLTQNAAVTLEAMKQAFYLRGIKSTGSDFDLLIWVSRGPDIGFRYQHERYLSLDEFEQNNGLEIIPSNTKSLRYVHCPYYIKQHNRFLNYNITKKIVSEVCELIVGVTPPHKRTDQYISNSSWTASMMKSNDVTPDVVYPPVEVSKFKSHRRPWDKRENGFVCVGRLARDKNVLQNIEIVDQLRKRGHDVHLHIIGIQTDKDYFEEISQRAQERDYVYLEGEVSKSRLIELICTHKYGIHGKDYERFGIVVAEMVAGGAIPFVPNSGGQKEIIESDNRLIYQDVDDALNKIQCVLEDLALQHEICSVLTDNVDRFGKDRFMTKIQEEVGKLVGKTELNE